DHRVQGIVAAAQVDDDEAPRPETLCLRDRAQERRRGEPERHRRDTVTDKKPSRNVHYGSLLNELVLGGADEKAREASGPGIQLFAAPDPGSSAAEVCHQRLLWT